MEQTVNYSMIISTEISQRYLKLNMSKTKLLCGEKKLATEEGKAKYMRVKEGFLDR